MDKVQHSKCVTMLLLWEFAIYGLLSFKDFLVNTALLKKEYQVMNIFMYRVQGLGPLFLSEVKSSHGYQLY